ncbi:hypothetical protein HYDPIDRAFT_113413 [Hydnomerulius pinastri MD-312]|uniref:Uncharacterized protein n=1 Tax=Hydnomerulius pinastri MD-312 TaxID=994086 RepID=A0A0C9WEJ9_9AGAM|nr:hypothetical protein HYDPIDRAFT_113413 [Hydnomerulius pinastri MD-312]
MRITTSAQVTFHGGLWRSQIPHYSKRTLGWRVWYKGGACKLIETTHLITSRISQFLPSFTIFASSYTQQDGTGIQPPFSDSPPVYSIERPSPSPILVPSPGKAANEFRVSEHSGPSFELDDIELTTPIRGPTSSRHTTTSHSHIGVWAELDPLTSILINSALDSNHVDIAEAAQMHTNG